MKLECFIGGFSLKTIIPLISLSLPWEETLDHRNMRIVSADTPLLELELKEINNIARSF
jgi:hypothetical protein